MSGSQQLLLAATPQVVTDANFEYTTLLLPGNGTNGAQNNTFLDGSTNNFTITRNGNTTQGTFSPFSQTGWGNYFDGTGDWISAPSNAVFDFSGDFTIELWFYATTVSPTYQGFCGRRANAASFGPFSMGLNGASVLFSLSTSGSSWALNSTGGTVTANSWNHVAFVRSGTACTAYLNGTSIITGTVSGALASSSQNLAIATFANDGGDAFNGYISNFRVVKGTAVYTAAFTPPTAPLTAITNTSLLTCQSNRFVDNSTNAFAITVNGNTSIQAFSPFNPTASWSAATNGGSGYFDGSGDYLSLADNAAFAMGTGNFTAEFWLYTADQSNNYPGILSASTYNDTGAISIRYDNTGNANKIFIYLAGASPSDPAVTSSAYAFGQWIHVAVIRDSSTALKIYVNGALDGTATISSGQNVDFSGANSFYIGRGFDVDGGAAYYAGYITNVRLVKGQALASGNFTPPTAPVTASSVGWTGANAAGSITGTVSLLMSATNAGIYDATSKNDLETVGNAQISTTQSKFGGSSMYFDGTGDWLIVPSSAQFGFGTGDFTVECWVYTASFSAIQAIVDARPSNTATPWSLSISATGLARTYDGSTVRTGGQLTASAWNHVAWSRSAGTNNVYVNGVLGHTWSASTDFGATKPLTIGAGVAASGETLTGYINDLRITKGVARYTADFTPPTAAFPVQ